jgi:arsenite/tail-anchored protein-transporting ATPase
MTEAGGRTSESTSAGFLRAIDSLAGRRLILFGGKGGVGKTTIATAAALHLSKRQRVVLFTTDPASNLGDLLARPAAGNLTIEALDAEAAYARFLAANLEPILEIGDRGTYLDRDELRRLLDLAMPGADELMGWMRMAELAEQHTDAVIVLDTAPTGHTLRMLSSGEHFAQLAAAFDTMQEKHRALVRQFTRREGRDAIDAFIEQFAAEAARRRALLEDASRTAFIPVTLAEPLVTEQTIRLCEELSGIDIPFVVLNRTHEHCAAARDADAREALGLRRVVDAPRACFPLDSAAHIEGWLQGSAPEANSSPRSSQPARADSPLRLARMTFLAGKGGVGKTSCAASIALQLALDHPDKRYVVISVDPAHSLPRLFESIEPPRNLSIETIDTKAKWRRFRDSFGEKIDAAIDALTPGGMTLAYDEAAMRSLLEIAPPGADELFAITRLAALAEDESLAGVIVDTAPTGHFLRLLDLPQSAGEWVREFMRIVLRYRELMSAGSLGEELLRAARALRELDAVLRSQQTAVIVVARPERLVIEETTRLVAELERRGIAVGGLVANYVTPKSACPCDASMREFELTLLEKAAPSIVIERRERPPSTLAELRSLVSLG